jgi:hypothetical protein
MHPSTVAIDLAKEVIERERLSRRAFIRSRRDVCVRTLLIQVAHAVLRPVRMKHRRGQALDPLQAWALKV